MYYEVDISDLYLKLGSFTVNFYIFANDESSQLIGCNKAYVTPEHSNVVKDTLTYGTPVLIVVTGLINFFTVIYSSHQESSNPFLFVASTICNKNLLKQLDATVEEIITYLQFALFIGGLDLQYPGFYQPLIGQIRWCALMGFAFITNGISRPTELDNIYVTLDLDGLKNLASYSNDLSFYDCWPNFIVAFIILTLIMIVAHQLFLILKLTFIWLYKREYKPHIASNSDKFSNLSSNNLDYKFTMKKNLYHIFGQILKNFFAMFGLPFLVLTLFMLYNAATLNGKHKYLPKMSNLKDNIFSTSVPYDMIFSPNLYFMIEGSSDNILDSDSENFQGNSLNFTNQGIANYNTTSFREFADYVKIPTKNIVIGSILLTLWIGLALFFMFNYLIAIKNWRICINKKVSHLYTSMISILIWGFCYCKYHPDKVYFVIIDTLTLFLKLLIIGCLQSYGSVQVSLLIVIEFFGLLLLFALKPYFVRMTWSTSRWMLPVARFLVTVLCIPYVRSLELSETIRTYVAFAQLSIHVFVAIVFIIHLFYCLSITVLSIIRERRANAYYEKCVGNHKAYNSIEEFNTQFEYHPVVNPIPLLQVPDTKNGLSNTDDYSQRFERSIIEENEIDIEEEDLYYRAPIERQLQKVQYNQINGTGQPKVPFTKNSDLMIWNDSNSIQDSIVHSATPSIISFQQQQQFSNIRKRTNNYTFREGDLIYKKYFTDDSIDPEIKALWASRNNWNFSNNQQSNTRSQREPKKNHEDNILISSNEISRYYYVNHPFEKIKSFFGFESENRKLDNLGFLVSRPRQLIVKSYGSSPCKYQNWANEYD